MNTIFCAMNTIGARLSSFGQILKPALPTITNIRSRHHADKIAKGPILRRFGYDDKLFKGGLLPHVTHKYKIPKPDYAPRDAWSQKRALFGQNDYIDILGCEGLHPVSTHYHLPAWLRGAGGNEYQMLLRKRRMLLQTSMPVDKPKKWNELNKRIKYLYKVLNQKTKTGRSNQ